jgi:hypothetical protein
MKRLILFAAVLLSGCANYFSEYYRGMPNGRLRPEYIASTEPLKIYSTNDFSRDVKDLLQRGYVVIGQSAFNAGRNKVSEGQLREQAEKVGAQVVLCSSQYTHTVSGAVPLTLPKTTTSYSTGTATAFGPGGPVTAYGSGTTTTYGTQTTYMPYSIDRADFQAVYLARAKTRIGFYAEPLDDGTRRRLGRNAGVRVGVVVEGTPAFDADILPGDVLLSFGGGTVQSVEHYQELLRGFQGNSVELVLDRDGRSITKTVAVRGL